jgi:hypothetical protein
LIDMVLDPLVMIRLGEYLGCGDDLP